MFWKWLSHPLLQHWEMYAQFHKHNQCAEWRHWYSVGGGEKSHYCSWAMEKQSMAHITQNAPPPIPPPPSTTQPTGKQSLIPPSSKQYAAVCWENIADDRKRNHQRASRTCHSLEATLVRSDHVEAPPGRRLIMRLFYEPCAEGSSLLPNFVMWDLSDLNLDLCSAEVRRHPVSRCL